MPQPRVAFCVPSGEAWKADTACRAFLLSAASTRAGINLLPLNARGGDAAENRNQMAAAALEQGAEWLLFVDADMIFPADGLVRLLKWDVDIVGADYRFRGPPFAKIGTSAVTGRPYEVAHEDPKEGLIERGMLGLGFLLVRAAVLKVLPCPWFARTWIMEQATPDNPRGFATDDTYFCHFARFNGYKVWCDMAVTREVMHIGETAVPWDLPTR